MESSANAGIAVSVGAATARCVVSPARVSVTMPVDWMLRGYDLAIERLREAAAAEQANARDLSIALFEASNWLDSLNDRFPELSGSVHVRALLFARNRKHHWFAATLYYDQEVAAWTWYSLDVLPLPTEPKNRNQAGERAYVSALAGKRLDAVLAAVDRAVGTSSARG